MTFFWSPIEYIFFSQTVRSRKDYFQYWLEKQTRPDTKEEYSQKVDRNLIHSIQIIASLKDEVKQLWELL